MSDIPAFAISVRQPWAWAVIHGGKDAENRSKHAITLGGMNRHDRVAIHAAIGMTRDEYEGAASFMLSECGVACPLPGDLVRGAIIGSVSITGVTNKSLSPWFFGPWALELAGAEPCEPIPCVGELGAFRWKIGDPSVIRLPLPWMIAWPKPAQRNLGVGAMPQPSLFDRGPETP